MIIPPRPVDVGCRGGFRRFSEQLHEGVVVVVVVLCEIWLSPSTPHFAHLNFVLVFSVWHVGGPLLHTNPASCIARWIRRLIAWLGEDGRHSLKRSLRVVNGSCVFTSVNRNMVVLATSGCCVESGGVMLRYSLL